MNHNGVLTLLLLCILKLPILKKKTVTSKHSYKLLILALLPNLNTWEIELPIDPGYSRFQACLGYKGILSHTSNKLKDKKFKEKVIFRVVFKTHCLNINYNRYAPVRHKLAITPA